MSQAYSVPLHPTREAASGQPEGHLPALDGLRGLAILLVIVIHSGGFSSPQTRLDRLHLGAISMGWMGVDLFFVLSGFLITGILLDAKGNSHFFRNFYARRAVRIFPLYYGFLLLYCVVLPRLPWTGMEIPADYLRWPTALWLYVSNFAMSVAETMESGELAIFWSLAIEEQFYLFWPTVVFLADRKGLQRTCVALIAGSLVLRLVLAASGASWEPLYFLTPCRLDTLAAGALAACLVRGPTPVPLLVYRARVLLACTGGMLLGTLAWRGNLNYNDRLVQTAGYSVIALFFTALLLLTVLCGRRSPQAIFFEQPWLRMFGKYSYALYVFHEVVIVHLGRPCKEFLASRVTLGGSQVPGRLLFTGLVVAVTLAAALLSWHVYEKQFLKLKAYFPLAGAGAGGDARSSAESPAPHLQYGDRQAREGQPGSPATERAPQGPQGEAA
jgi:peptidoglycan/LPS O-acetylase OafA/YrhL